MKDIPFHPFSEEYPLMPALELAQLEEGMKEGGFDPRFPIVLYEKQVLDGRNRFLAAKTAGVKPPTVEFTGTEDEARAFVKTANEDRRHLAPDWLQRRRAERIERVADARRNGQSERTIAEAEKVSKSQVRRDLEAAAERQVVPPGPPDAETEESDAPPVQPESGKVAGRDGKTYPAVPEKKLCRSCRIGPAKKGCKDCTAMNKPETREPGVERSSSPRVDPAKMKPSEQKKHFKKKAMEGFGVLIRSLDDLKIYDGLKKEMQTIKDRIGAA